LSYACGEHAGESCSVGKWGGFAKLVVCDIQAACVHRSCDSCVTTCCEMPLPPRVHRCYGQAAACYCVNSTRINKLVHGVPAQMLKVLKAGGCVSLCHCNSL
jgi:hypothetical protein